MMTRKGKVLLIYTGGTIGMGVNHATGALHPLDFNNFVNNVPEFTYLKQQSTPISSHRQSIQVTWHLNCGHVLFH